MSTAQDVVVVGGGILGLSTALTLLRRRPGSGVLLVEKEDRLAAHQSGHTSGVIHDGASYAPGSLKASLCLQGARATRDFCDEHGVPYRDTGKLVVATDDDEVVRLEGMREQAAVNGVTLHRVDAGELRRREPRLAGLAALYSPGTGIVDWAEVCRAMALEVQRLGGEVRTGVEVTGVEESATDVRVVLTTSVEQNESLRAERLVACAGLQGDRLARLVGLATDVRVVPFRGEFYRLPPHRSDVVGTLVYPVPDPDLPFHGVHLTLTMDGGVTIGPNAVQAWAREGYDRSSVDVRDTVDVLSDPGWRRFVRQHLRSELVEHRESFSRTAYLRRVRRYCPSLTLEDLGPHEPGVRAQAVRPDGLLVEDFLVLSTERTVHVLNATTPAATAALPLAGLVVDRALQTPAA